MRNPPQDRPIQRATPHLDRAHKEVTDTMRLKRDIDADKRAKFRLEDMAKTAGDRAGTDYGRAAQAVSDRAAARADSLQAARKKVSTKRG